MLINTSSVLLTIIVTLTLMALVVIYVNFSGNFLSVSKYSDKVLQYCSLFVLLLLLERNAPQ